VLCDIAVFLQAAFRCTTINPQSSSTLCVEPLSVAIRVNCPQCQTAASVRDEAAGKSVRCKVCEGSIRVPAAVEDTDEEFGAPERARSANGRKSGKAKLAREGTPVGVIFAMACVGVLMLLNLWLLTGEDELVWKLIAVLRLFVEARVLWGLKGRQDQTALTATVAATMMTLLSIYVLYGLFADADVQMETTPKELFVSKLYFIVQTLAEVGVIVGVNLPGSRLYLAK
jgi:ribosomal protein S27E